MVYVGGELTTCCLDTKLLNTLGNLKDQTLKELWQGEKIHSWRMAQIRGDFAASGPYCTQCNWQSAGFYPPDKCDEYVQETGAGEIPPGKKE